MPETSEPTVRCPVLGGPVPYRYCLTADMGEPCEAIDDCWAGRKPGDAPDAAPGEGKS